jgi:hypothetical protein
VQMNCPHRPDPTLPYLNAISDAEERMKRGEKQRRCPCCVLWIWESYYHGYPEWPTKAQDGRCIIGRIKR